MAHVLNCMLESEPGYLVKPDSPQPSNDLSDKCSQTEKPFVWRMHQQPERKYQLFPKEKQATSATSKGLDPEQAFALAMSQTGEKSDKPPAGSGLRLRIKEHNLTRRRKVSVPDLGPMTTVQEVAMDSPTIPGRPPLHERSISAPGHSWKPNHLADCIADIPPAHDEMAELSISNVRQSTTIIRQPLSPKSLAPLIIPSLSETVPRLARQLSLSRLRAGSTPVESATRSARTDDSYASRTPFTPLSAASQLITPKSATTTVAAAFNIATPISAPAESRSSPKPWSDNNYAMNAVKESAGDPNATPRAGAEQTPAMLGHRRGHSESGSIMERGRPRKRTENKEGTILKRSVSKRSKSTERRAFETLPKGWKASEAVTMLSKTELGVIQKQALQQAARFEVLRKEDVDRLSMELRNLDERTEYLRRTYTSLRAGRRNLHSRICQYLRSPRMAKFSHDSMLKQEEALAELDASIDDWVTKLEQAENRRTRVRQKLLEHVAAAVILPSPTEGVVGVSESLQMAMGIKPPVMPNGTANISTPPRSPTKPTASHSQSGSPSPQRVVAQVPSTIFEQPLGEEAASQASAPRRDEIQSIRVYAGDDVYALLADVENEFTKMSASETPTPSPRVVSKVSDEERKKLYRQQSRELLSGSTSKSTPVTASGSLASSPVSKKPVDEAPGEILLTAAVFQPEKSTLVI